MDDKTKTGLIFGTIFSAVGALLSAVFMQLTSGPGYTDAFVAGLCLNQPAPCEGTLTDGTASLRLTMGHVYTQTGERTSLSSCLNADRTETCSFTQTSVVPEITIPTSKCTGTDCSFPQKP